MNDVESSFETKFKLGIESFLKSKSVSGVKLIGVGHELRFNIDKKYNLKQKEVYFGLRSEFRKLDLYSDILENKLIVEDTNNHITYDIYVEQYASGNHCYCFKMD